MTRTGSRTEPSEPPAGPEPGLPVSRARWGHSARPGLLGRPGPRVPSPRDSEAGGAVEPGSGGGHDLLVAMGRPGVGAASAWRARAGAGECGSVADPDLPSPASLRCHGHGQGAAGDSDFKPEVQWTGEPASRSRFKLWYPRGGPAPRHSDHPSSRAGLGSGEAFGGRGPDLCAARQLEDGRAPQARAGRGRAVRLG